MNFLAPVWLLGLLPWLAVGLYLLWGRRNTRPVPFLELWRVPAEGRRPRRKMAAPPVALAVALAGMLLAVLAAAAPVVHDVRRTGKGDGTPITIIVDRGIEMSARGSAG